MLTGWVLGICDRILAVLGAFAFSQIPLFYQQYTQRLAGHVAESEHQVGQLKQAAVQAGKTLPMYIDKFLSQSDVDFVLQGRLMQATIERLATLREAYEKLAEAAPWWRPYYFIKYSQIDVAQATLHDFTPGVSLSFETGLYAIFGMSVGYLCFRLARSLGRFIISLGQREPLTSSASSSEK